VLVALALLTNAFFFLSSLDIPLVTQFFLFPMQLQPQIIQLGIELVRNVHLLLRNRRMVVGTTVRVVRILGHGKNGGADRVELRGPQAHTSVVQEL
jgi:hypothetical protein